jgi:hypothetical protein
MQCIEDLATEFDSDIPSVGKELVKDSAASPVYEPERLQRLSLPQSQEQQRIHEFAAAHIIQVVSICTFSFVSPTQGLKNNLSQVFCIVVLARDKGVQPARQTIDGRVVRGVIFVGKDDMKASVQLLGGDVSEMLRDKGECNEVGGRGLWGTGTSALDTTNAGSAIGIRTCLKISFCVSDGRSRIVTFFAAGAAAASASASARGGAAMASACSVSMSLSAFMDAGDESCCWC